MLARTGIMQKTERGVHSSSISVSNGNSGAVDPDSFPAGSKRCRQFNIDANAYNDDQMTSLCDASGFQ